jgi:hypothetical protein
METLCTWPDCNNYSGTDDSASLYAVQDGLIVLPNNHHCRYFVNDRRAIHTMRAVPAHNCAIAWVLFVWSTYAYVCVNDLNVHRYPGYSGSGGGNGDSNASTGGGGGGGGVVQLSCKSGAVWVSGHVQASGAAGE